MTGGRCTVPAKKVTCDCGKTMREPDDEKLVQTVQKHAKEVHNMTLTREQVLAMAEPA
jgi:predicted small metal-binding protein